MLQRYHGVDIMHAGIMAMIAYGFSGVPGLLIGGWAADELRARRVDGRLLVGGVSILLAIPLTYGALIQKSGETVFVTILLGLGCGLMYVYYAAVYPTLHDVVEPRSRGTAMALYFFAMYVLGALLGPYVMGATSDHFALQSAAAAGVLKWLSKICRSFIGLRDFDQPCCVSPSSTSPWPSSFSLRVSPSVEMLLVFPRRPVNLSYSIQSVDHFREIRLLRDWPRRPNRSLMSQSVDGIHHGGAAGGVESKENTHQHRNQQRDDDRPWGDFTGSRFLTESGRVR